MNRKLDVLLALFLIICGIVLVGCMSGAPSEATFLLEQDYLKMTNTQLVDYEQRLSDELVSSSRTSSGDVGIGFSFGSWGSSSGYGVRTDQRLAGSGENSTTRELSFRRDDVRNEMRRRGLLPE
jgi:hypothetical protein